MGSEGSPICYVRMERKKEKEKNHDDEAKCRPLSGNWQSRNHFLESTEDRSSRGSPLNGGGCHRLSGVIEKKNSSGGSSSSSSSSSSSRMAIIIVVVVVRAIMITTILRIT